MPKDVYCALFILFISTIFLTYRRLEIRLRVRTWEFLLAIAMVYVAAHTLLNKRLDAGWSAFLQIVYFCALTLILSEILSEDFQKRLWLWIAGAAAVNAALTILQYFGLFPFMIKPSGEAVQGRLNPAGFIGDVNSGGFLFGLACLSLLYGMLAEQRRKTRIASVLLFSLNLAGLAFTATLTALIALGVSLALWLVFHHWWLFRTTKGISRRLLWFWLALLLGLSGTTSLMISSGVKERVNLVWSQVKQGDWTLVTAGRLPVYVITWEMIKQRPWVGHGLNTFGQDFFYYRSGTSAGQSVNWLIQSGSFREAHNEYLQIWEELGLLGLVFFLVLLFWPLVSAVPLLLRTQDPRTSYWIGVLCLGLVFVSVSCLSFFPFHVSLTTAYVALLFACLRHFENQERTGLETARPLMVWKLVSFFALAAWLAYPHVLKWRANNEMGLAAEILEGVAVSDLRPQQRWLLASVALRRLDRAERFYPRFYEIYNLKGSAFLILGQPEEALRYYQKALPHLPSPELFTNLAAVHLAQRRFEQARSLLELALKYNPAYERARRALDLVKANER